MLGTVWDLHCFWLHDPNHIPTWFEGCTRAGAEDGVSVEWLHTILGWYDQDGILNVGHDDWDDNEDNRAIDIHGIHRQRGSAHRGHLPGSLAISARRHCSRVECGLLEVCRWRDCHDEAGVHAKLTTWMLLRIGCYELLAILAWGLWLCCWEAGVSFARTDCSDLLGVPPLKFCFLLSWHAKFCFLLSWHAIRIIHLSRRHGSLIVLIFLRVKFVGEEPFDQFLDAKGRRKGSQRKRKEAERVFEGQTVWWEGHQGRIDDTDGKKKKVKEIFLDPTVV